MALGKKLFRSSSGALADEKPAAEREQAGEFEHNGDHQEVDNQMSQEQETMNATGQGFQQGGEPLQAQPPEAPMEGRPQGESMEERPMEERPQGGWGGDPGRTGGDRRQARRQQFQQRRQQFQDRLHQGQEQFRARQERMQERRLQNGSGGPPAILSVADELKKLAELRDSGALSPEEFESQKAKLLSL